MRQTFMSRRASEPDENELAERIRDAGWRQGAVLPSDLNSKIGGETVREEDLLIVISSDCDVVARDFGREPHVEVLVAREKPLADTDGSYLWGKNPRVYQFQVEEEGAHRLFEVAVKDALRIDRAILAEAEPDGKRALSSRIVREISVWMSKRYHRAAFPDAFDSRTTRALTQINKLVKRDGGDLLGFYLVLSGDELPPDVPYEIELVAVADDSVFSDPVHRAHVQSVVDSTAALLDACTGVDVLDVRLCGEDDITLADLRVMRRWDFDDLSFRTSPPGERTPPQV